MHTAKAHFLALLVRGLVHLTELSTRLTISGYAHLDLAFMGKGCVSSLLSFPLPGLEIQF